MGFSIFYKSYVASERTIIWYLKNTLRGIACIPRVDTLQNLQSLRFNCITTTCRPVLSGFLRGAQQTEGSTGQGAFAEPTHTLTMTQSINGNGARRTVSSKAIPRRTAECRTQLNKTGDRGSPPGICGYFPSLESTAPQAGQAIETLESYMEDAERND